MTEDETDQASEKNNYNLCAIVLCLCAIVYNVPTPGPTEFCLYRRRKKLRPFLF